MKISYDKQTDVLYLKFSDKKIKDSEEIEENVVLDFDENNKVAGVEILYFVKKYRKELFPAFKEIETMVWQNENL